MFGLTALSLTDLVLVSARLERVFAELALEYRQLPIERVAEPTCESSQRDRGASPRWRPGSRYTAAASVSLIPCRIIDLSSGVSSWE